MRQAENVGGFDKAILACTLLQLRTIDKQSVQFQWARFISVKMPVLESLAAVCKDPYNIGMDPVQLNSGQKRRLTDLLLRDIECKRLLCSQSQSFEGIDRVPTSNWPTIGQGIREQRIARELESLQCWEEPLDPE